MFNVDFYQYMQILVRQRTFIFVFCLSAVITSLTLTYITSERYIASASILYRPVDVSLLRQKSIESFGAPVPAPPFKVISQTLSDIIKSESILRSVVQELQLDKEILPRYGFWYERWFKESKKFIKEQVANLWEILKYGRLYEKNPEVEAIISLRSNIDIRSTKDSYLYLLFATDNYPERAAMIVDAVGRNLVEWVAAQDAGAVEKSRQSLEAQMVEVDSEIARLRTERYTILQQSNVISVAEEIDTGVSTLYSLDSEQKMLVSSIEEKRGVISGLSRDISAVRNRYVDPEDLKNMKSQKLFSELELQGLIAKRTSLEASIQGLKSRLALLTALQQQNQNVDLKLELASRNYAQLNDLSLEIKGKAAPINEVQVMNPAVIPTSPAQPVKIYHVGLTAFLSLFVSTGLVYVFGYFNVRVFFHSQVKNTRAEGGDKEENDQVAHG